MDSADLFEPEAAEDGRAASDLATLLVELGRVVKARAFYPPGDPKLAAFFQRALQTWQSDLKRHGALELEVGPTGFCAPRSHSAISRNELVGLTETFASMGLRRVRFETDIDAEALAAFIELLSGDASGIAARGGFERALYARVPSGIIVNGKPPGLDAETPPTVSPPEPDPWVERDAVEMPTLDLVELDEAPLSEMDLEPYGAESSLDVCEPPARSETRAAPRRSRAAELEEAPLERAIPDTRSAQIVDLLREMDDCDDDPKYAELARRVVIIAQRLSEEGRLDDTYRVVLELSRHAGHGKRTLSQATLAGDYLTTLATGVRLADLIDRACAPGADASVRATQVLLQLGEVIVPDLLEAAETERDPDRRGQMHGILIAMGEKTLPTLLQAMDGEDPGRVRNAIRLAGESQNPGAIPRLAEILIGEDPLLREEAAKALVRIGSPRALSVLIATLNSKLRGLPALAAYCLGASGSAQAVDSLLRAMHEAIEAGRIEFAREVIRALGRLGRPEATAGLADLVLSKGLLKRRRLRDLKVAAASALGRIPGDDAVGALAQAAQSRDTALRRAAQTALDRRAKALTGD